MCRIWKEHVALNNIDLMPVENGIILGHVSPSLFFYLTINRNFGSIFGRNCSEKIQYKAYALFVQWIRNEAATLFIRVMKPHQKLLLHFISS